jgi:hypothetical protein
MDNSLAQAIHNNAAWCDQVCRVHGQPGTFDPHAWLCPGPTPPFYPNLVTLTGPAGRAAQIQHIQALQASGLPGAWAVKDSYRALDLTPLGFQALFEAQWLWRAPEQPLPRVQSDLPGTWARVETAEDLARWELAWGTPPGQAGIFLPGLLQNAEIAFLAAWRDQEIVAGGIAYRSSGVVGLSNLFSPKEAEDEWWAGALDLAARIFPSLPLVDYEHGDSLALARSLGFQELGPLVIWALTV